MRVISHIKTNKIQSNGEEKPGDSISSKLFTLVLENTCRTIDLEYRGITIDGEKLYYLRFADVITFIATDRNLQEIPVADIQADRVKNKHIKTKYLNNKKKTTGYHTRRQSL